MAVPAHGAPHRSLPGRAHHRHPAECPWKKTRVETGDRGAYVSGGGEDGDRHRAALNFPNGTKILGGRGADSPSVRSKQKGTFYAR